MSAYDTPEQKCPYCGNGCEADFVDIGIGMQQCGPYHCYVCGASEIGPEMEVEISKDKDGHFTHKIKNKEQFSIKEIKTGWYDPNKEKKISPYANTINGNLVDHKTAKQAYNFGILDEK